MKTRPRSKANTLVHNGLQVDSVVLAYITADYHYLSE